MLARIGENQSPHAMKVGTQNGTIIVGKTPRLNKIINHTGQQIHGIAYKMIQSKDSARYCTPMFTAALFTQLKTNPSLF